MAISGGDVGAKAGPSERQQAWEQGQRGAPFQAEESQGGQKPVRQAEGLFCGS